MKSLLLLLVILSGCTVPNGPSEPLAPAPNAPEWDVSSNVIHAPPPSGHNGAPQ